MSFDTYLRPVAISQSFAFSFVVHVLRGYHLGNKGWEEGGAGGRRESEIEEVCCESTHSVKVLSIGTIIIRRRGYTILLLFYYSACDLLQLIFVGQVLLHEDVFFLYASL